MKIEEYIESNSFEIRNCITKYIGYIITVIFASGVFVNFFNNKSSILSLLLITSSLVFITFIFLIIWYKFKSHNRFEGYKSLLAHEVGHIKKSKLKKHKLSNKQKKWLIENNFEKDLENEKTYPLIKKSKLYIKFYKNFVSKKKIEINDINSFNISMSRLNDTYLVNRKMKNGVIEKVVSSSEKSQFVFSTSSENYKRIEIKKNDESFFRKIIHKMYDKNRVEKSFILSYNTLFKKDINIPKDFFDIDNRYSTISWKYPILITKIGILSTISIFTLFVYVLVTKFTLTLKPNLNETIPILLLLVNLFIIGYWYKKFFLEINELIYGRYSIDGYLWKFFLFRVQYLNRVSNIIPVYFSRNFNRFFKTNLIIRFLYSENIDCKKFSKIEELLRRNKTIGDNLFGSDKNSEIIEKIKTSDILKTYFEKLTKYQEFNTEERMIHTFIKEIGIKTNYNNV